MASDAREKSSELVSVSPPPLPLDKRNGQADSNPKFRVWFARATICLILAALLKFWNTISISSRIEFSFGKTGPRQGPVRLPPCYDIPDGLTLDSCINWSEVAWGTERVSGEAITANMSGLEVDSGLFFTARGYNCIGVIQFSQPNNGTLHPGDAEVAIQIEDKPEHRWFIDSIEVCKLSRNDGSHGVGVFLPKLQAPVGSEAPYMEIEVNLPPPDEDSEVLDVPFLETDMPHFWTILGFDSKERKIRFKDVRITGDSGMIKSKFVEAENIAINTDFGPVGGHFMAHSSVTIKTELGFVHAQLDLSNNDPDRATVAKIHSTTGYIYPDLDLLSGSGDPSKRKYIVEAKSENPDAQVYTSVKDDSEKRATLQLDVVGGLVETHFSKTFYGSFDVTAVPGSTTREPSVYRRTWLAENDDLLVTNYSEDRLSVQGSVSRPGEQVSPSSVKISYSKWAQLGL
ncbi:hypothetical protein FA15DRAFT_675602 [Coprinopsis marcescibilis]|uniref:Uncharacterized protein n=1 Tax=Coprinopsis marcescibilis TaxID=230819 RepID=A0A5C3KDR9_COPMA|nr:hypothetical protein FA15DRAFT_675602 [Coprinopsis marcescibilis]